MADYAAPASPGTGSDDPELEAFLRRYDRAKKRRAMSQTLVDECYEYALPLRERVYSSRGTEAPDTENLFDSTAPAALQDLASQMLDDIWPVDAKPFDLGAGSDIPPQLHDEMNKKLAPITEDIIETVNNSNFRNEAHEALMDWGIGTGILLPEEGDALEPVRFRCLPLPDVCFDTGPRDSVDAMFRPREIRAGDLKILWPDGAFGKDIEKTIAESPEAKIEVVEGTERDWTKRDRETWKFGVVAPKHKQKIAAGAHAGDGSKPFIDFSFTRIPGEVMGRGPVMIALPDIKTLNLVKQFVLENADLAIAGVWQAEDDGIINLDTVRIEPRTIISKAPGSKGLERLDIRDGGFNIAELVISDLRNSIKEIMFGDDLGSPNKTPFTATEVLERTSNRARHRAGPYSRLINELLFQVVRRVAYIRVKQGAFQLPSLDGRTIRIRPLAPITRAQAQDEILRHQRYMEIMLTTQGPQQTALTINGGEFGRWLAQKMGVEPRLVRTRIESQKMEQAIAAMSAMAATQGQAPGG